MKLWQRAVSLQKRQPYQGPPRGMLSSNLFPWMGSAPMGKFEVNGADLNSISQQILKASPPIYALVSMRGRLFGQGRFQFQRLGTGSSGIPGDYFGNPTLGCLEEPWVGGSTSKLLTRMLLHVDLMGNAYVVKREDGSLKLLRPDWITAIYGSTLHPDLAGDAIDGDLLGYVYVPRSTASYIDWNKNKADRDLEYATFLEPHEVAHFAPNPDPEAIYRGMSWLTPLLLEVDADLAALVHKGSYFKNGMTPKMAIKFDPGISEDEFKFAVAEIEKRHGGPNNSYRTMYLAGGADPVPLSQSVKDTDFLKVTDGGEVRLAAAAGLQPAVIGFNAGLTGSSLNAGNLQQLTRLAADTLLIPLWGEVAEALQTIVPAPGGSRLVVDTRDIPFLRDDAGEAATVLGQHATTINSLVAGGFKPDSVLAAVQAGDLSLLEHDPRFTSVQLQLVLDPKADPDGDPNAPADPPPADPAQPDPAQPDPKAQEGAA